MKFVAHDLMVDTAEIAAVSVAPPEVVLRNGGMRVPCSSATARRLLDELRRQSRAAAAIAPEVVA